MKKVVNSAFALLLLMGLSACHQNSNRSKESSESVRSSKIEKSASSSTVASTTNKKKESPINTRKLTTLQVKKWVAAVWGKGTDVDLLSDPKYKITVTNKDGLVYASVDPAVAQTDNLGVYRVNSDGFLEADGYHQHQPFVDWVVISKKYLDTSMVPDFGSTD